jgi:uncharacterized protein (DUF2249 family)
MTQPTSGTTIDVRTIPPHKRHPLVFRTFDGLGDAQARARNESGVAPAHLGFSGLLA